MLLLLSNWARVRFLQIILVARFLCRTFHRSLIQASAGLHIPRNTWALESQRLLRV